ncbi:MAG: 2Fe-2S iron-sulfur cluster-binding protein [Bdellovibrionales bacterium]
MLKCTVNGKEIEVKEGTSVIEAFKQADESIAHYCWHPGLSVAGVCRLCMVEVEGMPRLTIACNTQVTEGMIVNNNSEKVKEAVKWGLEFHLINHPLDCPICDQAGECELQNQYMEFGEYNSEMAENKVKKRKVVSLGERVVLDTERCILCSRCVRFTEEVTETHELGIFNRGDNAEIGTHKDKPLNNQYSVNTVDICPVGALTSKDFRFEQRVWYLDDKESTCPGCSTGCSVNVYYNEKSYFRVKPAYNPDNNGYWMCDKGRETYTYVNKDQRLLKAMLREDGGLKYLDAGAAAKKMADKIQEVGASNVSVLVTAQYTNEEYSEFFSSMKSMGVSNVYRWNHDEEIAEDFDGLLIRGDKNPNTAGLKKAMSDSSFAGNYSDLASKLDAGNVKMLIVAGPENQEVYKDLEEKAKAARKADYVVWLGSNPSSAFKELDCLIPTKTWVEKDGTFTNYDGKEQKLRAMRLVVSNALNLGQFGFLVSGSEIKIGALA